MSIFLHEDFYRQIELIPEENIFSTRNINDKISETITVSENGWFDEIIVRPETMVKTANRKIELSTIQNILESYSYDSYKKVLTGYSSYEKRMENTYAYTFERIAIFVEFSAEKIVTNLYFYTVDKARKDTKNAILPKILNEIGERFNLILVDWDENISIRLKSINNIYQYLSEIFGFVKN